MGLLGDETGNRPTGEEADSELQAGEHENSPENGVASEEVGNVVRFWIF